MKDEYLRCKRERPSIVVKIIILFFFFLLSHEEEKMQNIKEMRDSPEVLCDIPTKKFSSFASYGSNRSPSLVFVFSD